RHRMVPRRCPTAGMPLQGKVTALVPTYQETELMKRRRCFVLLSMGLGALVSSISPTRSSGDVLFFDDFNGPTLNPVYQATLPVAPDRYQAFNGGGNSYVGAPTYSFATVDGATTLHLQSVLDDVQRAGWSTSTTFSTSAPIVFEARFNTMVQSATSGIDE